MPVPTLAAIRKHPMAVIMHQRDSDTDDVFDKTFEWFDTPEAFTTFLSEAKTWAADGVKGDKSWEILLVAFKDTATLETETVVAYGFDTSRTKAWMDGILADVETLFKKPPRKDAEDMKAEAYTVEADIPVAKPRVVKSRRKSAAVEAIEVDEPEVKPKAKSLKAALRAKGERMVADANAADAEPDEDDE